MVRNTRPSQKPISLFGKSLIIPIGATSRLSCCCNQDFQLQISKKSWLESGLLRNQYLYLSLIWEISNDAIQLFFTRGVTVYFIYCACVANLCIFLMRTCNLKSYVRLFYFLMPAFIFNDLVCQIFGCHISRMSSIYIFGHLHLYSWDHHRFLRLQQAAAGPIPQIYPSKWLWPKCN